MSILKYFKHCSKEVLLSDLCDPSGILSKDKPSSAITAVNKAIKDFHQGSKMAVHKIITCLMI